MKQTKLTIHERNKEAAANAIAAVANDTTVDPGTNIASLEELLDNIEERIQGIQDTREDCE